MLRERPETAKEKETTEMRKNPIRIAVFENGERIGTLSVEQFRAAIRGTSKRFLDDQVEDFNARKEQLGEPTRVKTELVLK